MWNNKNSNIRCHHTDCVWMRQRQKDIRNIRELITTEIGTLKQNGVQQYEESFIYISVFVHYVIQ